MYFMQLFGVVLACILAGDSIWLGVIMRDFYRAQIGHLMADAVNWYPAIIFYLVFAMGLVYFAILPHIGTSLWKVVFVSFLFGALAYATYDLTNHATLKDWPLVITVIDILWGAVISGVAGGAAYLFAQWLR